MTRGRAAMTTAKAGAAEFEALGEADPAFAAALATWGAPAPYLGPGRRRHGSRFAAITRSVMGQQLSVKAAATIHGRVVDLLGGEPTPENVVAAESAALRAAGLSFAKIRSIQGIALAVQTGDIDLDTLDDLSEDDASAALVALPGVGPWTAHMFLMFVLGRPDVLASGDVGVRNGIRVIFGLERRPTEKELIEMARPWSPHRTAACRLAWHVLSATPL